MFRQTTDKRNKKGIYPFKRESSGMKRIDHKKMIGKERKGIRKIVKE